MGTGRCDIRSGRPRSEDPKVKLDNVRLRSSLAVKLDITYDALGVSKTEFVETAIEKALEEHRTIWEIEIIF
ncbi:MAG TPA: hypothetical protein CFH81_00370 [Sulfurovum sp. UBA12169]|nr:MAG TPA: hypothetical protein CFH81_00370 [Sulfurovum sp. UBA12169]